MTTCQLSLNDFMETLRGLSPQGEKVYLVGGAVRDMLLQKTCQDLDLVVEGEVQPLARRLAHHLGASYFVIDEERGTVRLLLAVGEGRQQIFDFAALRAPSLEGDLRARDFTVNAMALDIHEPERLIDPLGGARDLLAGVLRACSENTFLDDPLRILRGVRLSLVLGYRIDTRTFMLMRAAVSELNRISGERIRDELFKMLDCGPAVSAVRLLDQLGALKAILPECAVLKGVAQPSPHLWDVWEHTLAVAANLERLFAVLVGPYNEDASANLMLGTAVGTLGRYREKFGAHFSERLNPNRSLKALLVLAALYHDIAKPETRQEHKDGKVHFYEHEHVGAEIAARRGRELALSQAEVERLALVVRQHMRVHFLVADGPEPSRRAVYRFFRDTGDAGVDLVLLSMADRLATEGFNLTIQAWQRHLAVCRALLEAWWEHPEPALKPVRLVNGHELQQELGLQPGPIIGSLLEALLEAQAVGEVNTREEALAFAADWLERGEDPAG